MGHKQVALHPSHGKQCTICEPQKTPNARLLSPPPSRQPLLEPLKAETDQDGENKQTSKSRRTRNKTLTRVAVKAGKRPKQPNGNGRTSSTSQGYMPCLKEDVGQNQWTTEADHSESHPPTMALVSISMWDGPFLQSIPCRKRVEGV